MRAAWLTSSQTWTRQQVLALHAGNDMRFAGHDQQDRGGRDEEGMSTAHGSIAPVTAPQPFSLRASAATAGKTRDSRPRVRRIRVARREVPLRSTVRSHDLTAMSNVNWPSATAARAVQPTRRQRPVGGETL